MGHKGRLLLDHLEQNQKLELCAESLNQEINFKCIKIIKKSIKNYENQI